MKDNVQTIPSDVWTHLKDAPEYRVRHNSKANSYASFENGHLRLGPLWGSSAHWEVLIANQKESIVNIPEKEITIKVPKNMVVPAIEGIEELLTNMQWDTHPFVIALLGRVKDQLRQSRD